MNKVILIGRLTSAPDVRYAPGSQLAVARFSVALDRGKDKDGNDRGADFPRIVVFGKQAENCERFLAKGLRIAIEGHIQTGSYQNNDGVTVYTTDVVADRVEFLDFKEKSEQQPKVQESVPEGFSVLDDSIPF